MSKKLLRFLALALALCLLLSGCASGNQPADDGAVADDGTASDDAAPTNDTASDSEYPEYLNLDSDAPVIRDEYAGTIKLKVVAVVDPTIAGDWDQLWISRYLRERYNLEFEIEYIPNTSLEEKKSIMLMSGNLPDIMIDFSFTTVELLKYGQEEGLFLQCDQYLNETLTPNIVREFADYPGLETIVTCPDGHIYTMPFARDVADPGAMWKVFINEKIVTELGAEMPRTLDEFVALLYAAKEAYGEDFYPLGGDIKTNNSSAWILNALGYLGSDGFGTSVTLRDGEVVIPAYDTDVFQKYLELMNQFYADGIIDPAYFTMESMDAIAQVANGNTMVINLAPYTTGIDTFTDWAAMYPLTSETHAEPAVQMPAAGSVGNFVISANTEYPELCLRFADLYFNNVTDDAYALWVGETYDSGYDYGYCTEAYDPETGAMDFDPEKLEGMDAWSYIMGRLAGFRPLWGTYDTNRGLANHYEGYDPYLYDVTTGEGCYRQSVMDNVAPYLTDTFPNVYYTDAETAEQIITYKTVLEPYIQEQVALFITGGRDLSEIDDFRSELESMGMGDLLGIYQEIWANTAK